MSTGFAIFCQERRRARVSKEPIKVTTMVKECAAAWKALSEKEKQAYRDRAGQQPPKNATSSSVYQAMDTGTDTDTDD